MIPVWLRWALGAWAVLSVPAALAIARAMHRMGAQIDAALSTYTVEVDYLADQPVEILSPAELDARFARLVAPIEAERDMRTGGAW